MPKIKFFPRNSEDEWGSEVVEEENLYFQDGTPLYTHAVIDSIKKEGGYSYSIAVWTPEEILVEKEGKERLIVEAREKVREELLKIRNKLLKKGAEKEVRPMWGNK